LKVNPAAAVDDVRRVEEKMQRLIKKLAEFKSFLIPGAAWGPAAAAVLIAWSVAGCNSAKIFQIESRLPEHQILIDGKADDWAGRLFIVEGQKVSLGFLNDRNCLYVCLRTDDGGMQRQLLNAGLTVWFDPGGGRKKVLGIKYPVGLSSEEQKMWKGEEPEESGAPTEFGGNLTDVEIYRPGSSEPEGLDIADVHGIELKAATAGKSFVYELKVPLAQTGSDAIGLGAPAGASIGIGFETGKFDLNSLPRRPSRVVGGAGGMPPAGGYGGTGTVMQPGRLRPNEPEIPEELKIWAAVQLSSGGQPAPAKVQSLSE
jgi:hypothetical protein